jgi:hypothetical protein
LAHSVVLTRDHVRYALAAGIPPATRLTLSGLAAF